MATTLLNEILGVKQLLDSPMDQSPSYNDIVDELAAEYQHMTNQVNNTAEAWMVGEYTLTTVVGTSDYQLNVAVPLFYKALAVYTVPSDVNAHPQYGLEFMELEYMPQEWAWLGQNKGQYMYSSHDSQAIAFYRTLTTSGELIYARLAPVPANVQSYKIIYQQTDWWDSAILSSIVQSPGLPNSSQRMYIRTLAAENLLMKGAVMWSYDPVKNFAKSQIVAKGLALRKERYKKAYDEYISSLDQPDITFIKSWADENVYQ